MMEAKLSSEASVLKEPHDITSQKTAFFIVTAVKASHLKYFEGLKQIRIVTNMYACVLSLSVQLHERNCWPGGRQQADTVGYAVPQLRVLTVLPCDIVGMISRSASACIQSR
jgi:hypothetical protein